MKLINEGYNSMVKALHEHFTKEENISLQAFFANEVFTELQKKSMRKKFVLDCDIMQHKYGICESKEVSIVLNDEEVRSLVSKIVKRPVSKISGKLYQITHESYKLREIQEENILVIFDLSSEWQEGNGGDICYANEHETLFIPPTNNTLSVVKVTNETEAFITYANHYTKGKKRIVFMGLIE